MEALPEEALELLNELSREEDIDIDKILPPTATAMPDGSQIAEMDSPQLTEREGDESLDGLLTPRTMDLGQSISGLSMGDPVPDFDQLVSNN